MEFLYLLHLMPFLFLSLNASGVTIRVIGRAVPLSQWEMERELRKEIKMALDEAGIEIPYPKTAIVNKK